MHKVVVYVYSAYYRGMRIFLNFVTALNELQLSLQNEMRLFVWP